MPKKISEAARLLSARGASKGGRARAKALSPARRKEIAQLGVNARLGKKKGLPNLIAFTAQEHEKLHKGEYGGPLFDHRDPRTKQLCMLP